MRSAKSSPLSWTPASPANGSFRSTARDTSPLCRTPGRPRHKRHPDGKKIATRQLMPNGNPVVKEINLAISISCAVNAVARALQKFLRVICPGPAERAVHHQ
jgi:hypothetical protein